MPTRRKFLVDALLGTAALYGGAACTSSPPSSATRIPARTAGTGTQRRLGVALVGLGSYSEGQLAPALQKTQHCELRGIVTGTPSKVSVWQQRHGIADAHVYDYQGMARVANDDAIDVLYIVLPTSLHAEYAVRAAEAGKHVWCEKPMAMNVVECQRIIDACRKNGVSLSIGYRMQHEPNTRTVMEYAKSAPYGAITGVRAEAGYYGHDGKGWRARKEMGGGALYDMGVYSINGIRYAVGQEPVRVVRASQHTARPELFGEIDETSEFELQFASGLTALGRTSFGEEMNRLRVDCERGWYELAPMQSYTGVRGQTSDGKLLNKPIDSQQARQMDDDALAILKGRPPLVPGEEGLRDIRLVEAIQQAAQSGSSVEL